MNSLEDIILDIALSPTLWLCVVFGLVYGVLFTLWRGSGWGQLARDAVVGVLGFAAGQLLASVLRLPAVKVGEVHLLWGSLASVFSLLVGRRLFRPRVAASKAKSGPTRR